MSTTLTNGLKLPDKGSVDWYADMQNNYTILDGAVGTIAEHTTALSGKAPLVHTHTKSDITDLLNSDFIPSTNNSYDFGSSSYQWNKVYSKEYYYNGTAWGLDKANEWTNDNKYKGSNLSLQNSLKEIGSSSSQGHYTIRFKDKNGVDMGYISHQTNRLRFSILNKFTNGVYDPSGSQVDNYFTLYIYSDGTKSADIYSDFVPAITQRYNLGNSTFKWKTINGINPGALSIFNPSASYDPIDIPTSWDTSGASWNTLDVSNIGDGWIIITYTYCVDGDYILARFGGTGGTRYPSMLFKASTFSTSSAYIYAFFPVAKAFGNIFLEMKINSSASLILHHFMPAYGTV